MTTTFDFSVHLSSCEHSGLVGIATRLRGGRSGVRIPRGKRDFYFL